MSFTPDREMQAWANRHSLSPATMHVLTEQGFTSLALLSNLTPQDVSENFQQPKLLPMAQCIALKKALQQLSSAGGAGGAGGAGAGGDGAWGMDGSGGAGFGGKGGADFGGFGGGGGESLGFERVDLPPSYNHAASAPAPPHYSPPQGLYPSLGGAGVSSPYPPPPSVHHPRYPDIREEIRFLLLGKTGSGKSTTGNTILGAKKFSVGLTFESVTDQCELRNNFHLGRNVQMMDSPGLFDTRRSHEEISIDIMKAVACMHPGPHAIVYVIPLGRYTEEEYAVYTRLKALFDDHLTKYLIVLFTGGDRLGQGQTMEQMLQRVPEGLSKVLAECGRRYILFNNMARDTRPYVQQLFDLVTQMNRQNGGQPYRCPKYTAVGNTLEAEVARRLAEVEEKEVERTRYVQELKQQTNEAHKAMEREREQFQKREAQRETEMKKQEEEREEKMRQMMKQMEEQQLSLEQQKQEERKLREQMERERREQWQAMEEQRAQERKEVVERERKWQEMMEAQREEDRKRQEERDHQYMEMMKETQKQIANTSGGGGGGGIFGKLLGVVSDVVGIFSGIKNFFKKK